MSTECQSRDLTFCTLYYCSSVRYDDEDLSCAGKLTENCQFTRSQTKIRNYREVKERKKTM